MLPDRLTTESFSSYPPEARQLAREHLALLRQLPLGFLPLLLREVIAYDWKFPVERAELVGQFGYLEGLSASSLHEEMKPFSALRLSSELENSDWVNAPAQFSEKLSAHLWATHQIEHFRTASVEYVRKLNAAVQPHAPVTHRLGLVVMGRGAKGSTYRLFRKLRRHGTYFADVDGAGGRALFTDLVAQRARQHEQPYGHWFIDGGVGAEAVPTGVTHLSYDRLQSARVQLITKMRQVMAPGGAGPEALRTMMARMSPEELGMKGSGGDALLNRFEISILTEGSGTQLFSTTFVQWSAREVLRRAQPVTLLLTYAPRQREQSMQQLLSGKPHKPEFDGPGSLIDADMGAYYTWLNMNRLIGADQARFLAWFEEGTEAVAIGPSFAKGSERKEAVGLRELLAQLG